ncbi:pci domain-containing protein [Diaporthe amygdali]|uniref:pci domain-containing protein n=1 Tax=Phomopsis amygdali TaxID=1214568 RepID=UPI0022FEBE50|nr:pci domain-containing protein [Diaporthe amygdali]KAJ0121708.1 pci domain-containing protein [Diaporthe amygdali]
MRSFIVASALSALLVSAQNSTFSIDPTEVTATLRAQWCSAQTSTCNTLCDSNPNDNSCEVDSLDFSCTCQNGSAPGLQYYTQTIDTFVCQQAFTDCNEANVGNAKGQENCTTSIQDHCGTLDPADYSATPSSTGSSTASATSGSSSSTASSGSASSSSSQAAAPTNIQHLGTGALAAGMGVLAYLL